MKKLNLALDDLMIESFDTSAAKGVTRGTVLARDGGSTFCSGDCTDPNLPSTWTENPYDSRCCYTWGLDSRCADSLLTNPGECGCWPVE